MELRSVTFEAFKSLYDVTCELDHFTVITGPNGAGKSNFVDGLNFIGEVYTHGLEFALARAGGFENVAHRRSRRAKKPIAIKIDVELSASELRNLAKRFAPLFDRRRQDINVPRGASLVYHHSFSLKTAGQGVLSDFKVESDEIRIATRSGETLFRIYREGDEARVWISESKDDLAEIARLVIYPFGDDAFLSHRNKQPLVPTELLIEQAPFGNILSSVKASLRGIRVFQLSPHMVRGSGVSTPNANLERHGENLPGAADHLRRNDVKAWESVQQAMRAILPALEEIQIAYTEDRRLALQFRERSIGRPWNTNELSDGTIQALALYVALFDRRSPVLAIEEPENSIHPWILRQFLDLCAESRSKQIVITSHSPVLLNYVDPRSIRLMSISGGRSQVKRFVELSPEVAQLALSGEITLFEAYDSGIVVEAVPQGLTPGAMDDTNELEEELE